MVMIRTTSNAIATVRQFVADRRSAPLESVSPVSMARSEAGLTGSYVVRQEILREFTPKPLGENSGLGHQWGEGEADFQAPWPTLGDGSRQFSPNITDLSSGSPACPVTPAQKVRPTRVGARHPLSRRPDCRRRDRIPRPTEGLLRPITACSDRLE